MSKGIQEDPTNKTSGLTSALQIIDITPSIRFSVLVNTDDITFSKENNTSDTLEIIHTKIQEIKLKLDLEKQKFQETLNEIITKNINIFKELSKY